MIYLAHNKLLYLPLNFIKKFVAIPSLAPTSIIFNGFLKFKYFIPFASSSNILVYLTIDLKAKYTRGCLLIIFSKNQ